MQISTKYLQYLYVAAAVKAILLQVYVCEDCGHTTKEPEVHYVHLKEQHPYSPALLKFYDKRHFKFNNTNFASNLITPAMQARAPHMLSYKTLYFMILLTKIFPSQSFYPLALLCLCYMRFQQYVIFIREHFQIDFTSCSIIRNVWKIL